MTLYKKNYLLFTTLQVSANPVKIIIAYVSNIVEQI
jgi:hypothetical protein